MAEPGADGVYVHTGAKQVHCGRVPDRMGAHLLLAERWDFGTCLQDVSFKQREYAEACDRLLPAIEEYGPLAPCEL